jgi:hypothetical protein
VAFIVLMGKNLVLEMLILSPKHSPKKVKILYKCSNSLLLGSAKIATSSAYSEHLQFAAFGSTRFRTPLCAAASMMSCRGYKSGDSRS